MKKILGLVGLMVFLFACSGGELPNEQLGNPAPLPSGFNNSEQNLASKLLEILPA